MKIEKEAYICQRCSQVCFEPYEVPFANRSSILMCYQCLWDAIERSGGKVNAVAGGEPVITFRTLPL